ncbi:MAG: hypothetical protein GF332_01790 [Candidatus Moranbacteria bacterium]|nr:hypothetical protein [Candidatus Moranbacteria bacterium]
MLRKKLDQVKKQIEDHLGNILDQESEKAAQINPAFQKQYQAFSHFVLNGGKRLRAALVMQGAQAAQSRVKREIVYDLAAAIELIHAFLIIQDDVFDRDQTRRGRPTLYRLFAQNQSRLRLNALNAERIGQAQAFISSDLAFNLSIKLVNQAHIEANKKQRILEQMNDSLFHTLAGESLDLNVNDQNLTQTQILNIYMLKTAKYTFENPLLIGLALGQSKKQLERGLANYAMNLGVAYQIKDDLIGIFSSKKELGKDIGSDIQEGKQTLLTRKMLIASKPAEKRKLEQMIQRKQTPDQKELDFYKQLAHSTKALHDCEAKSQALIKQAKLELKALKLPTKTQEFLLALADYVLNRKY